MQVNSSQTIIIKNLPILFLIGSRDGLGGKFRN